MWERAFLYGGLTMEILSGVLGGTAGGYLLDRYFATEPLFIVLGILLGFLTGVFILIMGLRRLERSKKSLYEDESEKGDE